MTSDGRFVYTWNAENRMVMASNAEVVVTYAYDHQGRMISKEISRESVAERRISYIWDNWNIIRETLTTNNTPLITHNVWGLDLAGTLQDAGGVGGFLAVMRNDGTYLPTYDANGNIMRYFDVTDDAIVASRDYSPFGNLGVSVGACDAFTHWFSTKPWCSAARNIEYQYRKYRPEIGRWMSRDPIGKKGGVHINVFLRNAPIDSFDPKGLVEWLSNSTRSVYDMGIQQSSGKVDSYPGGGEWDYDESTLAMTGADWEIKVFCRCDDKAAEWRLNYVQVTFTPVVHFRISYASNEQKRWVRVKEQDHVGDYRWWARNEGKKEVEDYEKKNFSTLFPSETECVSNHQRNVARLLTDSFESILIRTVASWDQTGRHTWED